MLEKKLGTISETEYSYVKEVKVTCRKSVVEAMQKNGWREDLKDTYGDLWGLSVGYKSKGKNDASVPKNNPCIIARLKPKSDENLVSNDSAILFKFPKGHSWMSDIVYAFIDKVAEKYC